MDYKEYAIENKEPVKIQDLTASYISKEQYVSAHQNTIIVCADVMIWYNDGFLLVKRDNVPALGELWPIGGRIQRGISMEENVRDKVKSECNLDLDRLVLLNVGRTSFKTDPFNHGKGTDTINFMYLAEGIGKIKLDNLHSKPTIVTQEIFNKIKSSLHPYVVDFMETAFKSRI